MARHYKRVNPNANWVQDWLSRAQYAYEEIQSLCNSMLNVWELMTGVSSVIKERVQTSAKNSAESNVVEYLNYEKKIIEHILNLISVKDEIAAVILQLEDSRLRILLVERYINFKKWEEIMQSLNYERSQIFKLHNKALEEVEKILLKHKHETK